MKSLILSMAVILCAVALCVWLELAWANPFTCDDAANTCTYRAIATEPTKKVGGAALDNYKHTNFKSSLNGGQFATITKPATAPTGGGTVNVDFTFVTSACGITTFTVKASGTNTLNAEGPETAPLTVQRDRTVDPTCAPAMPGLTIN